MRIALDATYSVDPHPSGIAVYSRELLSGLATAHPEDQFLHCYRLKQFFAGPCVENASKRLLLPPLPTFRADLFHALNQRADRRSAKRVVCTFHDLFVMTNEYSTPDFRARFTEQARQAAANADLIIAVSQFTADQVHTLLHVPEERIRVVPHGVKAPATASHGPRENMVLFVGALQVRKNVIRLIEAFQQMPRDWTLKLAGATGFGAGEIIQHIETSPAHDRITIMGYVSDQEIDALYARASIFAFPSLDEGFGMPVLEAMAHGVPVVTSNRSALPEVAGDTALLVNPFRTGEIASALLRLADDANLRAELAEAGRQRVKLFSWQSAVEGTYSVYRELTS